MSYPLTFYVDSIATGVEGRVNGPIVRIVKSHKGDAGLHAHELVHIRQWATLFAMGVMAALIVAFAPTSPNPALWYMPLAIGYLAHDVMYTFSKGYRLWAEVQAYKEQAKHYPDNRLQAYAENLAGHYSLGISKEQALRELTK